MSHLLPTNPLLWDMRERTKEGTTLGKNPGVAEALSQSEENSDPWEQSDHHREPRTALEAMPKKVDKFYFQDITEVVDEWGTGTISWKRSEHWSRESEQVEQGGTWLHSSGGLISQEESHKDRKDKWGGWELRMWADL